MIKYICKHCLNVQYISTRMAELAHRLLCFVCGNNIPKANKDGYTIKIIDDEMYLVKEDKENK
mgnify:FL=1